MTDSPALVIFDLDGTLVDPAGSITGGIAFALEANGLPVPDAATLDSMVGPPLLESLSRLAEVPADVVPAVVHAYRRRYISTGMTQSRPYPGIPELLDHLRGAGYHLAVATQKPEALAKKLLTVQGLDSRFHSIHGAPDDETLPPLADGKASIVAAALAVNHAVPERSLMIGDRRHDAAGAEANGLRCVGVAWGFAEPGELEVLELAAYVSDAVEAGAAVERLLPLDGYAAVPAAAPVLSGSADPEPVEADSCR
ncbi:HAD hydrolase-like protein [Sinomonas sp. ASV322]|uniref:HAD hydrolase-like protein n=1 Tax=Sinomonas sp. ASV322 TaxID=3041920 RepID=UPI0027DD04CF|nr:HAD hydrolase-like protein [Sinomonas sp. ASV322]MDQ4500954.1 HAD hydrolase-like protein [Sinomonas sp. ASV322]